MQLPSRVDIREEGPRDGWQNLEDAFIPTEQKVYFIEGLVGAGIRRITVTALVHPKWVPQLADAEAVLRALHRAPGVSYGVLVPNAKGFDRARRLRDEGCPIDEICLVSSVTEAHNRSNVNMSVAETLAELEPIMAAGRAEGLHMIGGMATVFGCSFEGRVPEERVLEVARAHVDMGAAELVLGDTTGMANPLQVEALLGRLRQELPEVKLTPHFHNTRGAGLANVLAALSVGIDSLEASFGELGGCQFARGATGNIATEDLVSMLSEMGIETGIDLPALLVTVAEMEEFLGRRLESHVSHAGPVDWTGGE